MMKATKALQAARNDYREYRRWLSHGPGTRRHLKREAARARRRADRAVCRQWAA